jgi:hypothetical protein
MLRVTEGGDPLLGRAMAIYRVERRRGRVAIEIVYRVIGRGTALLAGVDPGRSLWLLGPLGRAFPDPPGGARPLLVGGGTGIASSISGAAFSRPAVEAARALTVLGGPGGSLCRADFAGSAPVLVATDDETQEAGS